MDVLVVILVLAGLVAGIFFVKWVSANGGARRSQSFKQIHGGMSPAPCSHGIRVIKEDSTPVKNINEKTKIKEGQNMSSEDQLARIAEATDHMAHKLNQMMTLLEMLEGRIAGKKSRVVFTILALALGCFGVHNFYICKPGVGVAQLLYTVIVAVILFVLSAPIEFFVATFLIIVIWVIFNICTTTRDGNGDLLD